MIIYWLDIIKSFGANIIISWSLNSFDFPYLQDRAKLLEIKNIFAHFRTIDIMDFSTKKRRIGSLDSVAKSFGLSKPEYNSKNIQEYQLSYCMLQMTILCKLIQV